MPQGLGLGGAGGGGGGKNLFFLNMVKWHIKFKGMSSRQGYIENFYPTIKLDEVKGSRTIRYLRELGDLRWRAIECVLVLFELSYCPLQIWALKTCNQESSYIAASNLVS